MSQSSTEPCVPLDARLRLGHAVLQAIADDNGIDLLHIKGYSVDEGLYFSGRASSDVDVLVRPEQAARFVDLIAGHEWRHVTSFRTGSVFEHAAVSRHDTWGYVDVHRVIPGVGLAAGAAFDRLWATSRITAIAERECRVPSRIHQALVIALHEARAHRNMTHDTDHLRSALGTAEWTTVANEALAFDAEIAWAAATGDLDRFTWHREHALWTAVRGRAGRFELLRARARAARSLRQKVGIFAAAALPNRDHLRMSLGREPRARDLVGDVVTRVRIAIAAISPRGRDGRRRGPV